MKTCTSINDFDRISGMQMDLESRIMEILKRPSDVIYQTKERECYRHTGYHGDKPGYYGYKPGYHGHK